MKIKTIDSNTKTWFDKANGNTYFSTRIVLNYGMKSQKEFKIPFEYGYSSFDFETTKFLVKEKLLPENLKYPQYLRDAGIIFRQFTKEGCKKKEVIEWGKE